MLFGPSAVGRVARGLDVLRGQAARIEARGQVGRPVRDRGRQVDEDVRAARIDERALPVDAAVEQIGRLLHRAPDLVAAVRRADRVGAARRLVVAHLHRVLGQPGRGQHVLGPLRERLGRVVVEEVDPDARCRVQPAGQRVVGRGRRRPDVGDGQVEDALVLRGVGVALLDDVVAPREVAVVLAARAGRAGDDELAVPVVRQAEQEAGLAGRVVGEATRDLEAGHGLRDRRAVRRARRDDGSVGLRREGPRRQTGDRVVRRGGRRVVGRQVGAGDARDVRGGAGQRGEDLGASGMSPARDREPHESHESTEDRSPHGGWSTPPAWS